jgi:hypothetical protein
VSTPPVAIHNYHPWDFFLMVLAVHLAPGNAGIVIAGSKSNQNRIGSAVGGVIFV